MTGQVGEIPGHGSVAFAEQFGAIDKRDVVEFRAADPLRLNDPEQARFMQIALGLRRQPTQFFGPRRPVSKLGDKGVGAGRHGRKGAIVRTQRHGLACDRLLTYTRHVAFLAFSICTLR